MIRQKIRQRLYSRLWKGSFPLSEHLKIETGESEICAEEGIEKDST